MTHARPTQPEDILDLAPRLRAADVAEVGAMNQTPLQALQDGFSLSDECWTIWHDGVILGMFGVAPLEPGVGAVWLLASDGLPKVRWEFLKKTRPWVAHFLSKYPTLTNLVDSRNTCHIKWIKWAGFTITNEVKDVGPHKVTFLQFIKNRDASCAMQPLFPSSRC